MTDPILDSTSAALALRAEADRVAHLLGGSVLIVRLVQESDGTAATCASYFGEEVPRSNVVRALHALAQRISDGAVRIDSARDRS